MLEIIVIPTNTIIVVSEISPLSWGENRSRLHIFVSLLDCTLVLCELCGYPERHYLKSLLYDFPLGKDE